MLTVGDILTYTVVLTNITADAATNVVFHDTLPTGSVILELHLIQRQTQSDISGKGSTAIAFATTVNSVPTPPQFVNTASIDFIDLDDPDIDNVLSNSATTQVNVERD